VPCAPLIHPALKSDRPLSRGELLARVGCPPTRNIPPPHLPRAALSPASLFTRILPRFQHRTVGAAPYGIPGAGERPLEGTGRCRRESSCPEPALSRDRDDMRPYVSALEG
jgi:hypothetical protein